jgi:hypothetical protein
MIAVARDTTDLGRTWVRVRTTAGGWGAWSEIYSQLSILGAVGQTAGVPTGAIIETGDNANGSFIKFANGTLYCTKKNHTLSYLNTGAIFGAWTFPHSFIDADRYTDFMIMRLAADASLAPPVYRQGVRMDTAADSFAHTTANLAMLSDAAYTDEGDMSVNAFAIGRWFN